MSLKFIFLSKWKLFRQLQILWKNVSKNTIEGHFKSFTAGCGQSLSVNPMGLLFFSVFNWNWEADSQEMGKGRNYGSICPRFFIG